MTNIAKEKPEIERRFLTTTREWRNQVNRGTRFEIIQAYPEELQEEGKFVRIRKTKDTNGVTVCEQCEKGEAKGIVTPEKEWEIAEAEANKYLSPDERGFIYKCRWRIPDNNHVIFIDSFLIIKNESSHLVIIEAEFDTETEALAFNPPTWFGNEITGNHRYSNFCLAKYGEPSPM